MYKRQLLIHPELGFGADAILPEKRLIAPTLHKQIIRRELKRESLGEELRVLYVALTRAKEKLYITGTIAKLEETLARISYGKNREETLLPGGIRCGARNFWDVILPALAGHSAMRTLYLDYCLLYTSQFGTGIRCCMYRIGGRLRTQNASCVGVAVGIPPLQYWVSNQPP